MVEVRLLALPPGRLGLAEAVAALLDDSCHLVTELGANSLQRRATALILGGIVEQRGDRLVLGPGRLDHDRGHAEQVPDVRYPRSLPRLVAVKLECNVERSD